MGPIAGRMVWPFHEFSPDFGDDEVEAVARLGFNQVVINFDSWPPAAPQLFQMVDSEVWPGMGDPEILEWSRAWLTGQVERCRRFGVESYIFLFEPLVPFEPFSIYAPQSVRDEFRDQIEEECLGWRFPGSAQQTTAGYEFAAQWNSMGRPLCLSHPKVQAFYRSRMRELARMLPGLNGVMVLSGDGRMEFCDHHCPRCRREGTLTGRDYQTQGAIRLFTCLHEGAAEVRADFKVILDTGGMLPEQVAQIVDGVPHRMPLLIKDTGLDCDMAPLEPYPSFRKMVRIARERGIEWHAFAEFACAEEYGLIFGYPDPITSLTKLQNGYDAGARDIAIFWGLAPQAQTINDRVLARAMDDPGGNPRQILWDATEEVFGSSACAAWIEVWHRVRAASEMWIRRRGYHSLRLNFYAARFRLVCWPVDFTLTSPAGVPEYDWQWPMCFTRVLREANLPIMPDLLAFLDEAIEGAREALEAIPAGTVPARQVYRGHAEWDSRRYGQEALDAIVCVREFVASEYNTYRIAAVREVVEDRSRPVEERRRHALEMLPPLFQEEGATMARLLEPLRRQLEHVRVPRLPDPHSMRTQGNTEKMAYRYAFIPQLEAKIADMPAAVGRIEAWLDEKLVGESAGV